MKNKAGSNNKLSSMIKKQLLEEKELKKDLEATFKIASEDLELTNMAEEGLADYSQQLKNLESSCVMFN